MPESRGCHLKTRSDAVTCRPVSSIVNLSHSVSPSAQARPSSNPSRIKNLTPQDRCALLLVTQQWVVAAAPRSHPLLTQDTRGWARGPSGGWVPAGVACGSQGTSEAAHEANAPPKRVHSHGNALALRRLYLLRDLPTLFRQRRPPQPLRAATFFLACAFMLVVPSMLVTCLIPEPLH